MGDHELSLLHFNLDNAKTLKHTKKGGMLAANTKRVMDNGGRGRGTCYGFNYNKDGCNTKDCKWEHRCIA